MSKLIEIQETLDAHMPALQELGETEQQKKQSIAYRPHCFLTLFVGYLYFIQGMTLSLPDTMTMVYAQLPSYNILSLFSAASIPFSTKFIVAPLIEKFTFLSYGKRKTWVIVSQTAAGVMLFIASFLTTPDCQIPLSLILISITFLITLQDISLDALAIKELRLPHLVGFLQAIMQTMGIILGSLFLLKLTSLQFAETIGLEGKICEPATVFRGLSIIFIVSTFFIHFLYSERALKSEKTVNKKHVLEIIKYYRIFFDFNSKYCRTAFLFLIYIQGFNYFQAGYEYELIKSGFKRNTFNTISNISLVPITIIACLFTEKIQKFGLARAFMTALILKEGLAIFIWWFFPTDLISICFIYFFNQAVDVLRFLVVSIVVNSFPVSGISGMMITMLVSFANFGSLKTGALILTGKIGWKLCAGMGLLLEASMIAIFPVLFKKTEQASLFIDEELCENQLQNDQEETPIFSQILQREQGVQADDNQLEFSNNQEDEETEKFKDGQG